MNLATMIKLSLELRSAHQFDHLLAFALRKILPIVWELVLWRPAGQFGAGLIVHSFDLFQSSSVGSCLGLGFRLFGFS